MVDSVELERARHLADHARRLGRANSLNQHTKAIEAYADLYRRAPSRHREEYVSILVDGVQCASINARGDLAWQWNREAHAVSNTFYVEVWLGGTRAELPDDHAVLQGVATHSKNENDAALCARVLVHAIERGQVEVIRETAEYCFRNADSVAKTRWIRRAIEIGNPDLVAVLTENALHEEPSTVAPDVLIELLQRGAELSGSESSLVLVRHYAEVLTRYDWNSERLFSLVQRVLELEDVELAESVADLIAQRVRVDRASELLGRIAQNSDYALSSVGLRYLSRLSSERYGESTAIAVLAQAFAEGRTDVVKSTISELLSRGKSAAVADALEEEVGRSDAEIVWQGFLDLAYHFAVKGDPEVSRRLYERIIRSGDEKCAKRAAANLKFLGTAGKG